MKRINILYIIITVLVMTNMVTFTSLSNMSERASYHLKQEDKLHQVVEDLMDRIYQDNEEYYFDVLTETDVYSDYMEWNKTK